MALAVSTRKTAVGPPSLPRPDSTEVQLSAAQYAAAAGLANFGSKLLLHPLDTLKARLQAHPFGDMRAFKGLWTPRGLYRGLIPKLALSTPYQTVYMFGYRHGRDWAMPWCGPTGAYVCGATVAEVAASVIRIPMQVAKIRLQVDVYRSVTTAALAILHDPRGCYAFFGIQTLLHDIPYSIVQWQAYEHLRQRCFQGKTKGALSPGEGMACGSVAGATAAIATNPMEVVKTRVIAHAGGPAAPIGPLTVVRGMLAREGLRGFYRGLALRVAWISCSMGVYFGLFEVLKAQLAHPHPWGAPAALAAV